MGDKYISAAELSRLAGVNKQTVSRKIKQGVLVPASYTESNRPLFDASSSIKILQEQKIFDESKSNHSGLPKSSRGGRPKKNSQIIINDTESGSNVDDEPESHTTRFNKARADNAVYKAELTRLEVEEKLKNLVHVDLVMQQGSELGATLMNALTNLPDRLSDELASLDNARDIHKLLTEEINRMISDIRHSLKATERES